MKLNSIFSHTKVISRDFSSPGWSNTSSSRFSSPPRSEPGKSSEYAESCPAVKPLFEYPSIAELMLVPGIDCSLQRKTSSFPSNSTNVCKLSPPCSSASVISGTLVATGVTSASANSFTSERRAVELMSCSVEICKSEPTVASAVFSSTSVPVYPWTAASVTMESVSNIMTASRFTDSADPDPLSPLFTSLRIGDRPKMSCMICGPFAPILPRSNAPPIQRANGPMIPINPSMKKLETIPSSLPFISSHVSITASIPNRNAVQ